MKRFLKNIGRLLILTIVIASVISYASLFFLRKSSFYKPSFLVNAVSNQSFDYIVLGASTGLTTLNTGAIDALIDTKGINLAMDDTNMASQYLMLQHFLAEGKSTDFVILAPAVSNFNSKKETLSDNDYRYLMYVNRPYVSQYYQDHDGRRAKILASTKWLPMFGVSYFNTELFFPSLLATVKPNKRNRFDSKGNYTYPVVNNKEENILETEPIEIKFTSTYLKRIQDLCQNNEITLICYMSPIENKHAVVSSSEFQVINHSNLLQNRKYFYDVNHVNSVGREMTSKAFADSLKSLMSIEKTENEDPK